MNRLIYILLIMNTLSCSTAKPQNVTSGFNLTDISWDTDMSYGFLYEKDKETKDAMAVVNKTLRTRQKAYPRFKVGNVGFFDVITTPPPYITDTFGSTHTVAVIPGANPQLLTLPENELFARYAKNIRRDTTQINLSRRIAVAVLLATGSRRMIENNNDDDTSLSRWSDDGNTLVIRFDRLSGGGMIRPRREACILTVDENQIFTLDCVDKGFY